MSKFEDLENLKKLKEEGVLTEEEFNAEKAKILNADSNTKSDMDSTTKNEELLEIKGDFPFVQSKIPLNLLDGEKVIVQYTATTFTGAGSTAVAGLITLTNFRILFNKKSNGSSLLSSGLLGVALAAGNKDVAIKFSDIVSLEAKKIRLNPGIEIITKDGYSNKFAIQHNERDLIVELVNKVITTK